MAGCRRLIGQSAIGRLPPLVVGVVASVQLLEVLEHLAKAGGEHEIVARELGPPVLGVRVRSGGDGETFERLDVTGELPQLHAGGAEQRAVGDGPAAGGHLIADLAEVTAERLQTSGRLSQIARGAFLGAPSGADDGTEREVERHGRILSWR
jgi:hypothetical protein